MRVKCGRCDGTGWLEVVDRTWEESVAAEHILSTAAAQYGMTVELLTGSGRQYRLVEARRLAARRMRDEGMSLKAIGMHLGGRDHSTVHALLRPR